MVEKKPADTHPDTLLSLYKLSGFGLRRRASSHDTFKAKRRRDCVRNHQYCGWTGNPCGKCDSNLSAHAEKSGKGDISHPAFVDEQRELSACLRKNTVCLVHRSGSGLDSHTAYER